MNDFVLFPWQRPFLPDLKAYVDSISSQCPGNAVLVVPNRRPWRYLKKIYTDAPSSRPVMLPKMFTVAELVWQCRLWNSHAPVRRASLPDRVALLHEAVCALKKGGMIGSRLAGMGDMQRFFPWGVRLAALFEELFGQGRFPVDIPHMTDGIERLASEIYAVLGQIGTLYVSALKQREWTTAGLDSLEVALALKKGAELPPQIKPSGDRPVVLAGFSLLTGTEDVLLKTLWQAGAHVCLHGDANLVLSPQDVHWSCSTHQKWLKDWHSKCRLAPVLTEDDAKARVERNLSFFIGYDGHSQFHRLREELQDMDGEKGESTAIVLADSGLLLPVLHHLPNKNVNISMGYPLARTAICNLLEILLQLEEKRQGDTWYWRLLVQFLRHPLVQSLQAGDAASHDGMVRSLLGKLANLVQSGSRFANVDAILEQLCENQGNMPAATRDFLKQVFSCLLLPLQGMDSAHSMGEWLTSVCLFLQEHAKGMLGRFPLNGEAIYHLRTTVIPVLRDTILIWGDDAKPDSRKGQQQLFALVRQLLADERVPFEADPLTGIQVLGMLETRLLHFDRVFVLDATDDRLPGISSSDPLLPDSLRPALGLPNAHSREQAVAHHLYGLCASAHDVRFLWQEGNAKSVLLDAKKAPSRFIEQIVWDLEKDAGHLLRDEKGNVTKDALNGIASSSGGIARMEAASCIVHARKTENFVLTRTPAVDRALTALLEGGTASRQRCLSATMLNRYLRCPLNFALYYLVGLKPPRIVNEGDDYATVGNCVHKALQVLFEPWLGKTLTPSDGQDGQTFLLHDGNPAIGKKQLEEALHVAFNDEETGCPSLSVEGRYVLEAAAYKHLEDYLKNSEQPEATMPIALEAELRGKLNLVNREYPFMAKLDRVDRRDGNVVILDYKTENLDSFDGAVWQDEGFADLLSGFCDTSENEETRDDVLAQMQEKLSFGVQLPLYMLMWQAARNERPANACWVNLKNDGKEKSIFGNAKNAPDVAVISGYHEKLELCLAAILHHMETARKFVACPSERCQYCDYTSLCKR